jgi:DNA-binding transcriptional regulator YiaG
MTNHPARSTVRDWPAYLKAFRSRHGLTQLRLANLLPTSLRNIENWEGGINTPPSYLKPALRDVVRRLDVSDA